MATDQTREIKHALEVKYVQKYFLFAHSKQTMTVTKFYHLEINPLSIAISLIGGSLFKFNIFSNI